MMEKIKLTQEQAYGIELYLKNQGSFSELLNEHARVISVDNDCWMGEFVRLNELSQSHMARALLIGYEVKEEYKIGDFVLSHEGYIGEIENTYAGKFKGTWFNKNSEYPMDCTEDSFQCHATPEEIKAEQERRVWAGIGREVGEFRDGDFISYESGSMIPITDKDHIPSVLSNYKSGIAKGFYPAESFISFGGESHDN